VFAVLLFCIGIAIGIATRPLEDGNNNGAIQQKPGTSTTNSRPGGDNGLRPRPLAEDVLAYLTKYDVSKSEDLTTPGTPQQQAVQWLTEEDEARVQVPIGVDISDPLDRAGYLFVTRYIMALTYFALRGDKWMTQMNFLSPDPVCKWNGFSFAFDNSASFAETGGLKCDPVTGLPIVLDLGRY